MIKAGQIADILALYRKHGWTLRRVLLSDELKTSLANRAEDLFEAAEVRSSEIDAVWFSRPTRTGQEAWELRRLSEAPFALMEIFDPDDEDEIRDETLAEVESKLKTFRK